jgi:diguanylate cyclase (GGDEF)-like protein
MEEPRPRSLWPIWALSIALGVPALWLLPEAGAYVPPSRELVLSWVVIAAALVIVFLNDLEIRFRGTAHSFAVSEIVVVVALFSLDGWEFLLAILVATVVAVGLIQRIGWDKFFFNLASMMLGFEIALLVFSALSVPDGTLAIQNWFAALAATLACAVVQALAISVAVVVAERRLPLKELVWSFVLGLIVTAVNTTLGLVVVIVCSESLAAATLLVGPIAVVFVAYRAYLSEHAKSEGLQFLYRSSEILSGEKDIEGGLVALLDFARETFHTETAEVVLRGDADEEVGYHTRVGPGDRSFRLEPCDSGYVEEVIALTDDSTHVTLHRPTPGSRVAAQDGVGIVSLMVASFSDENGVRGAAVVGRSPGAFEKFDKDEISLFETFVNHLGTTLEKSRLSTSLAQLRALKQELAHQAYHDSLTGLANRLKFKEIVDEALVKNAETGGKVAVLFIDLDDFKTVNDTMGHHAGDALLEEVAARIARSVGEFGTAARLGGDEFAVLLPDVTNDSEVRAVADRILVSLGDPVPVENQQVVAQASIGIATHVGAADAAELMQHADVAMYTAKRNGKGRFDEFEPTMSLTVARRHQLKVGLERAIADGEFVLHYQPVIDAASGSICGTEALLRWKDPARGMMPPAEFVGVAEETGLIVPIGRFALEQACRQAALWAETMPDLRVFINLSTRQICDSDIVDDVANALEAARLDPSQIVLEVTETAMMRDIDEAKATLHALKQLGVAIAIDDFGTGFSSLSYLRQLPIDVLKIAKPIIDAICDSKQDAAFVKGIIELGHVVGLKVVAEGVERVEQYAHLIDMGCDYVQGYYYAPSMEPDEVTQILRASESVPGEAFTAPASTAALLPAPAVVAAARISAGD